MHNRTRKILGGGFTQVKIELDAACEEPCVVIRTAAITDEITALARSLSAGGTAALPGFRDGALTLLEPEDILRVYAGGGKVYVATAHGQYTVRLRLYECEERLDKSRFVRISGAELINLRQAESFDLSLAGTIRVTLSDGSVTYVSRRYVAKIKQRLGI